MGNLENRNMNEEWAKTLSHWSAHSRGSNPKKLVTIKLLGRKGQENLEHIIGDFGLTEMRTSKRGFWELNGWPYQQSYEKKITLGILELIEGKLAWK